MGFIWSLIVGGIIGAIAGAITNKGSSMGIIANVVAGSRFSWISTWSSIIRFLGTKYCRNGNRAIIDWCHHFSTNRIILCSKTVKRLLKRGREKAVLHQVIRTAKQK